MLVSKGVPPFQEADDSALARPGRANKSSVLTRAKTKTQSIENRSVGTTRVRKGDIVEYDIMRHGIQPLRSRGGFWHVDHGKELTGGDHGFANSDERSGNALQGVENERHVEKHNNDNPDIAQGAINESLGAVPKCQTECAEDAKELEQFVRI